MGLKVKYLLLQKNIVDSYQQVVNVVFIICVKYFVNNQHVTGTYYYQFDKFSFWAQSTHVPEGVALFKQTYK